MLRRILKSFVKPRPSIEGVGSTPEVSLEELVNKRSALLSPPFDYSNVPCKTESVEGAIGTVALLDNGTVFFDEQILCLEDKHHGGKLYKHRKKDCGAQVDVWGTAKRQPEYSFIFKDGSWCRYSATGLVDGLSLPFNYVSIEHETEALDLETFMHAGVRLLNDGVILVDGKQLFEADVQLLDFDVMHRSTSKGFQVDFSKEASGGAPPSFSYVFNDGRWLRLSVAGEAREELALPPTKRQYFSIDGHKYFFSTLDVQVVAVSGNLIYVESNDAGKITIASPILDIDFHVGMAAKVLIMMSFGHAREGGACVGISNEATWMISNEHLIGWIEASKDADRIIGSRDGTYRSPAQIESYKRSFKFRPISLEHKEFSRSVFCYWYEVITALCIIHGHPKKKAVELAADFSTIKTNDFIENFCVNKSRFQPAPDMLVVRGS